MPSATRRVAVIGAGISGVVTAAHLKKENLEVTVYERSSEAGGIWVYDERTPLEPAYQPVAASRAGKFFTENAAAVDENEEERLRHAPPGPCYAGLKNNVATRLLQTTLHEFPRGTADFVSHNVLKEYIQSTSVKTGVHGDTQYNTEVQRVEKKAGKWVVDATTLETDQNGRNRRTKSTREYDAVVVASGHYHAAKVPDTPGLSAWKAAWPDRIRHSKSYRTPAVFRGKTVLLIGGSVSSTDLARELGPVANTIYQSQRSGAFDLPATLLPDNAHRVGEVVSYNAPSADSSSPPPNITSPSSPIPATITLASGSQLCNIDHILLCTGYHFSLPFLAHLCSSPSSSSSSPTQHTLLTSGSQLHNLHRDIFYIPDPTLCFVGVPLFTATFTLFEFQATVVRAVLAGLVGVPSQQAMREEYEAREGRGKGKAFHSLRGKEEEYVAGLLGWVNPALEAAGEERVRGYTAEWRAARAEQVERLEALFAGKEGEERGETDALC